MSEIPEEVGSLEIERSSHLFGLIYFWKTIILFASVSWDLRGLLKTKSDYFSKIKQKQALKSYIFQAHKAVNKYQEESCQLND